MPSLGLRDAAVQLACDAHEYPFHPAVEVVQDRSKSAQRIGVGPAWSARQLLRELFQAGELGGDFRGQPPQKRLLARHSSVPCPRTTASSAGVAVSPAVRFQREIGHGGGFGGHGVEAPGRDTVSDQVDVRSMGEPAASDRRRSRSRLPCGRPSVAKTARSGGRPPPRGRGPRIRSGWRGCARGARRGPCIGKSNRYQEGRPTERSRSPAHPGAPFRGRCSGRSGSATEDTAATSIHAPGRRCGSRHLLQIDHVFPYALPKGPPLKRGRRRARYRSVDLSRPHDKYFGCR